jgi:hypothetical protein
MSPAPARRTTAAVAAPKVRFLDMDSYAGGNFDLPEGRYCMFFDFVYHAYTKQDGSKGTEFLATHLQCYNLNDPTAEPIDYYLSLGKKAKEAVAPNPADGGKSLIPIPGASGGLSRNTNSHIFLKSLLDCAAEPSLVDVDDLSQIDGVWVVTKNILEPEERKGYGKNSTGEVEEERRNTTPQKIPTVVEIIEGGAPWLNGGGLPEAAPAAKPAPKAPVRPVGPKAVAPPARRAPAPPPVEEEVAGDDEGMLEAIREAIGTVLSNPKHAKGVSRVTLRMDAFKAIKASAGEEGQQALASMFEDNPDQIESLLGEMGYTITAGGQVKQSA